MKLNTKDKRAIRLAIGDLFLGGEFAVCMEFGNPINLAAQKEYDIAKDFFLEHICGIDVKKLKEKNG